MDDLLRDCLEDQCDPKMVGKTCTSETKRVLLNRDLVIEPVKKMFSKQEGKKRKNSCYVRSDLILLKCKSRDTQIKGNGA
ncbi:hypothetical protein TNCV_134051 [Trichonephila clavipes]|nr:hypothetical protein TNCV_134051 [Trichonephila clavipes]